MAKYEIHAIDRISQFCVDLGITWCGWIEILASPVPPGEEITTCDLEYNVLVSEIKALEKDDCVHEFFVMIECITKWRIFVGK